MTSEKTRRQVIAVRELMRERQAKFVLACCVSALLTGRLIPETSEPPRVPGYWELLGQHPAG